MHNKNQCDKALIYLIKEKDVMNTIEKCENTHRERSKLNISC